MWNRNWEVRVAQSLDFRVMFCTPLFVLFHLAILLSVLRFIASGYPFGIFQQIKKLTYVLVEQKSFSIVR